MKKHAYLIMAHNEFHMLKKLLIELDDERNDIFIHIDKKTAHPNEEDIASVVTKSRVTFIPRRRIYWGHVSIVKCELELLKKAINGNYHYYHLLSGNDFPIKTQEEIHEFLDKQDGEFISCHKNGDNGDLFLYKIRYYFPLLRYVGKGYRAERGLRGRLLLTFGQWQDDLLRFQEKLGADRCKKDKDITPYKGDQWFSITNAFARFIVSKEKEILKRYRLTNGPDEFFIPTLAMNSEFGRLIGTGEHLTNTLLMI